MTSLLFNTSLLILEVLWLIWLRRRPEPHRAIRGLAALGVFAAIAGAASARFFVEGGFGMLRLHAWAIFGHGPLLLVATALLLRDHPRWRMTGYLAAGLLVLVAVYSFLIEPTRLEVSHFELSSAKLTEPVRIVLLADVQTDSVGEYERRAMELAMAESPDLILFAGDYVHVRPDRHREVAELQEQLGDVLREVGVRAPQGVFAVGGNVDDPDWPRIFEGIDAHVFETRGRVEVGELVITGLTFVDSIRRGLRIPAEERFHLVLGHAPDYSLEEVHADLLVAGHCHGGQVVVPFLGPPVKLSRIPRAWTTGAHEVRPGTTLVASRGIGLERAYAPQLRFNCRPEVVVIDLVPAER